MNSVQLLDAELRVTVSHYVGTRRGARGRKPASRLEPVMLVDLKACVCNINRICNDENNCKLQIRKYFDPCSVV